MRCQSGDQAGNRSWGSVVRRVKLAPSASTMYSPFDLKARRGSAACGVDLAALGVGGSTVGATNMVGRMVGAGATVGAIGSALVGASVGTGAVGAVGVAAVTVTGSGDGAAPVDGSVVPQPASMKNGNSAG